MFSNLSGLTFFSILLGVACAIIFSFIILILYKRAIIRGMSINGPELIEMQEGHLTTDNNRLGTQLEFLNILQTNVPDSNKFTILRKFLTKRLNIYAFSILCFAVLWTHLFLNMASIPLSINRLIICIILFIWPFVFLHNIIWATGRKEKLIAFTWYLFVFIFFSLVILMFQDQSFKFDQLIIPWVVYNAAPTIFIILIRSGKIRSISPLITGFCIITFLVSGLIINFFAFNDIALKKTVGFLRCRIIANLFSF